MNWFNLAGVCRRWIIGLGIACVLAGHIAAAEETNGPLPTASAFGTNNAGAWLYPPNESVLTNESVQIIAVCPKDAKASIILLDGRPIPMRWVGFAMGWPKKTIRSAGPPVRTASPRLNDKSKVALLLSVAKLDTGAHELVFEGITNRVFQSRAYPDAQAPKNMALFSPHPSPDAGKPIDCSACHEPGGTAPETPLGRVKMPDRCTTCHQLVDLRLAHSHVMEPLGKCSMCHDPHGSNRPNLLLDDRAKLCVQCHEAGHFK